MTGRSPRTLRHVAATLLLATGLAACSSSAGESQDEGSDATRGDVTVLQPGRPGEDASTVGPDAVPPPVGANHADIAFMQMMVPHHAQALEMARLAMTRASSPEVSSLARRIEAAQGPEIIAMSAWLDDHHIDVPRAGDDAAEFDHGEHGHTAMAGMLTDEQMAELEAARGEAFDRLFLRGMIQHHLGAIEMAQSVSGEGTDIQVAEIAGDVAVGQTSEVDRMRELLRQL